MTAAELTDLSSVVASLPESRQQQVLRFARALARDRSSEVPGGRPLADLGEVAGTLSDETADAMLRTIEKACGQAVIPDGAGPAISA